ncbi:hypothetical protein LWC35_35055 [Pseudonocardia kujensis]|uniref:transposase n=1 Tax=Pseudonocardia kujensis TaxID=1128675 RepID=UPI001E4F256A|nr:hypothetical protein [Pseudonocardia kujensis]MCE0768076.1 hypothetical protein [Pseudonocardia kujensis]
MAHVELLGRLRSDRVLRLPRPPRRRGTTSRPPRHGLEFALTKAATWPEPAHTTSTMTSRYGLASAQAWDRLHPRLTHRGVVAGATAPMQVPRRGAVMRADCGA